MEIFNPLKLVTAILLCFISLAANAQTEVSAAKSYLIQNASKENISTADIGRMEISSEYLSPTTGWYHIYFKQMYQSIEVFNGILNTTLKSGDVVHVANSFVPNLESSILQNPSIVTQLNLGKTQINPLQALQIAAANVSLSASNILQIQNPKNSKLENGFVNKVILQDKGLSDENIVAQLYWLAYTDETGAKPESKIALTYYVQFLTKDGKNQWCTHVDATTGKVLAIYDAIIHCDFGKPDHDCASHKDEKTKIFPLAITSAPSALAPNTYNVFDYPLEAPTFGVRTSVTSPYNRFAPANTGPDMATNGWHNDGTTTYTNTRGNNVYAKDDLANDNETTIGSSPSSATLDFDFPYTQATGAAAGNLNASITNLFYWNNVLHDVLWQYGFDEPSGNFQKYNIGRGGAENDYVNADAQDGSGTNNANFSTPIDGLSPRMQMYIWSNAGNPQYQPDSDFDNGIIGHEYGHGWSIRLTGGPANSSCLQNSEQGGEGWADYLGLMTTTNWGALSPNLASANLSRGVGTYVKGQATTGAGIRPFKYSYDKANVNNTVTYAGVGNSSTFSLPHGIGSIWATILWDMTWEIILQDNLITANIYTVPGNIVDYKGNIAALKLVNEGLRLQPCSPSFVQARDAILQADNLLFAGRYRCAISKVFTRRGLGLNASTGSSSNDRTVTEDFTPLVGTTLNSPSYNTACSSQIFSYTASTASVGSFNFAWTRAAVSGISNPAGSASSASINETLVNTTNDPITVPYFFTISPDICSGTPAPQRINVVVSASLVPTVSTYSVCSNATVPNGAGLVVATSPLVSTLNGTLAVGPTYVRGDGDNTTTYVGTNTVYYKTYIFVAPTSGAVTISTTAANLNPGSATDTYITLYQNSFDPASPATNFVRGDDDSGAGLLSSLTQTLTAGAVYIVVVSSYTAVATGTFTLQSSVAVLGQTINWYSNASGGSTLATGAVFNPVGVAGSGIVNTVTPSTTTFYAADALFSNCRTPFVFNIVALPTTPTITAVGSTALCTGQSVTLNSNVSAPNTVVWSPGGAITQSSVASAAGIYQATVSNLAGCTSSASSTVTLNPVILPTGSISKLENVVNTPLIVNGCEYIAKVTNVSNFTEANAKEWNETTTPLSMSFVPRHYEITPTTNVTTASGTITLFFTQADFDIYNANPDNIVKLPINAGDTGGIANIQIVKYSGESTSGTGLPSSYPTQTLPISFMPTLAEFNTTTGIWEITFSVTGFSGFFVNAIGSTPLPVTLISFKGKATNAGNELSWKVASEKNFSRYEIERSYDARNFVTIGKLKGIGRALYEFVDLSQHDANYSPQAYYRVAMLDLDESKVYSNTITINRESSDFNVVSVYPNPVSSALTISYNLGKESNTTIAVYDILGKLIYENKSIEETGFNSKEINTKNWASGAYFLKISDGENIVVKKILKQ